MGKSKSPLMSRPPLVRMLRLHEELQVGRHPNCRRLGEELEVSSKTIQRDLEFMRDQLGLPIAYDGAGFGYVYTEPVGHFPTVQVSEGELVALFVAQKALQQYRGTSLERPLAAAFEKITGGLKEDVSLDLTDWDRAISFRAAGAAVVDAEVFALLARAVRQRRRVEFVYRKLGGRGEERRRVDPYHLASVDHQWYLLGHDRERGAVRTFVLSRMGGVREMGEGFERPRGFSAAEYLRDSFGVFSPGTLQRVRIWFDPFAAQLVRERQWHPSQKIREHRDGSLDLELGLRSLPEVQRWVLGWGEHARVLGPAELRRGVEAALRGALGRYAPTTVPSE